MVSLATAFLLLQVTGGAASPSAASQRPADSVSADDSSSWRRRRRPPRRLPVTPEILASAFADAGARDLLLRARAARLAQDSALLSYDAKAYQRLSVGMGIRRLGRERLLLRTESASRVRWQRGRGVWLELTGQRTAMPMVKEAEADADLEDMAPIPYFPGREALWFPSSDFGVVRAEVDDQEMVHPIAEGAEAYYRYATGDSILFQLSPERRITLRELRITARRPEWKLFVGSFWFDVSTAQLVRAAYRMSADMDIWAVADEELRREREEARADTTPAGRARLESLEEDEAPGWVKGMLNPMRATISAITVEYGLHEGRFWMPRANVAEGEAQASFMRVPFRLEERFTYASVNGRDSLPPTPPALALDAASDSAIAAGAAGVDSLGVDEETEVSVTVGGTEPGDDWTPRDSARLSPDSIARWTRLRDSLRAAGDSAGAHRMARRASRARRELARRAARRRECASDSTYFAGVNSRYDGALRIAVRLPCDTTRLATSPDLPPSIYDSGEELFGEAERDELVKALSFSLQPGWAPQRPTPYWGLNMVRYNRVEGLSPGAGVRQVLGRGYTAEAQARLGLADLQPNGELWLARENGRQTVQLGVYRRLAVANNDWGAPLSFGASLASVLYAHDEGFYYRAWGGELTGTRADGLFTWRLFAERHDSARVETQFSVAHLLNDNIEFVDNIQAEAGTVGGLGLAVHRAFGLDPSALRLVTDARLEGAGGAFDYVRGLGDATVSRNIGRHLAGALTASAGWSGGRLPVQRLWYLGGSRTVRGQLPGTAAGDAYWMGRAELGTSVVSVRPVVFYDVGWAGDRDEWRHPGIPLSGAGVGASFLDGLVRFDVARGIQPEQRFRVDLYVEARF